MSPKSASKALALIGASEVEWWPTVRATADGAHGLTEAIVTMAYHALEEERETGSEIPPAIIKQVDPDTGELVDALSLSYEAVLRERALLYLQSLKLEADASTLEILADIFERQLFLHHPDQWASLSDFLRNMAAGKSASYQSIMGRFVEIVVPFLQVEGLATVKEMMHLITEGGLSNIYHLLANMQDAVAQRDKAGLVEMLGDAKSMRRTEIFDKYKRDRMRVLPSPAVLTKNPHWVLEITMKTEAQKRLILNRLGNRITYQTPDGDPAPFTTA